MKAWRCIVGVGIVAVLTATQANAITVTVQRIALYYHGNAGEFTLVPSAGLVWGGYGAQTHNQLAPNPPADFQTFCLEAGEFVTVGATYRAVVNDRAIMGGNPPNGDPISVGTAWLYYLFATQDPLLGYNYTPGWTTRRLSAQELQAAIWNLEDENGFLTSHITTLLINKFGSIANAKNDNNGQYPVWVLNLYDPQTGERKQDMLFLRLPDGGMTLLLLGLGVGGLAVVSRKLRK